jgi:hypothetical protein
MCEVTPGIRARVETLKYFELILARAIVANLVFFFVPHEKKRQKTGCEKEFRNLGVLVREM